MITVNVKRKEKEITEIVMKGHAMYADFGKDIVCAGVSAISITSINLLLKLCKDKVEIKENPITIKVVQKDEIVKEILENLLELMRDIEESYPKNLKIKEDNNE